MKDLLKRLADCGLEFAPVPPGVYPMGFDGKREGAFANSHPNFGSKKIFLTPTKMLETKKTFWIAKDSLHLSHFEALSKEFSLKDFVFDQEHDLEKDPGLSLPSKAALELARALGADLPHWYEWEAAMRGTEGYLYPWGNDLRVGRLELEKFEYTIDTEEDENDAASFYDVKEYYEILKNLGPYAEKTSPLGLRGLSVPSREWNLGPLKDTSGQESLTLRSITDLGAMATEIPGLVPDTWGYSDENRYLAFSGPILAMYCPENLMAGHPKQIVWPKARIRLVLRESET